MRAMRVIGASVCVACACLAQAAAQDAKAIDIREEVLGPIPPEGGAQFFSPDGSHCAMVVPRGGRNVLWVDGKFGPEHEAIRSVAFSPDGRHMAYVAVKGAKSFVVWDGRPGPEYDQIIGAGPGMVLFSPDSARLAYIGINGVNSIAVVDGRPGPEFIAVMPLTLAFSPDGSRAAYVAMEEGRSVLILDGKRAVTHLSIYCNQRPIFGPNGVFRMSSAIGFSADGRHVAYAAEDPVGKGAIFLDGRAIPTDVNFTPDGVLLSPDGKRVAWITSTGGAGAVVDGKAERRYDQVRDLVFSPEGSRFAYAARTGKTWRVVVDGKEGREFDEVLAEPPAFSRDGSRVAYGAKKDGKWFMVINRWPGPVRASVGSPVFSPDGKHLAYRAQIAERQFRIDVDGYAGPALAAVHVGFPIFTPDSAHVLALAATDAGNVVVVDDRIAPINGTYIPQINYVPSAQPDGTLTFIKLGLDGLLYRVRVTP